MLTDTEKLLAYLNARIDPLHLKAEGGESSKEEDCRLAVYGEILDALADGDFSPDVASWIIERRAVIAAEREVSRRFAPADPDEEELKLRQESFFIGQESALNTLERFLRCPNP